MRIALTFNLRHVKPSLENRQAIEQAEFDEPSTIKGITKALKKLGHKSITSGVKQTAATLIRAIIKGN